MQTIPLSLVNANPKYLYQITEMLEKGGILCFPTPSGYKLGADLSSHQTVVRMLQAKRRVKNAPSLVLVPDVSWVSKIATDVSDVARALMKELWPGPMTLLFEANEGLHPKVRKPLTKAKGWLGVRLPDDELSRSIVTSFNRPLLVSSANLAHKQGDNSAAQVRKNFGRSVDIMIDAGDLKQTQTSTLVDMTRSTPSIVRAGAVSEEDIKAVLSA
jgi:tRNA threonylcarbamoyl adenosine modification protein (Sua5/YciO/YrdC/YwlC family)